MKVVILMKLKLPLKEARKHQKDPAKVSRTYTRVMFLAYLAVILDL